MKFTPLSIHGAWLIDLEMNVDARGYFARTYCADQYIAHGLNPAIAQESISFNAKEGTLRGLHFQRPPFEEVKTVRCSSGAAFDVLVDLRVDSPSYRQWQSVELSAQNGRAVYIPAGVAHGFYTLRDDTTLSYQISVEFNANSAAGVRWDDPTLAIVWPGRPRVISERDLNLPLLSEN